MVGTPAAQKVRVVMVNTVFAVRYTAMEFIVSFKGVRTNMKR